LLIVDVFFSVSGRLLSFGLHKADISIVNRNALQRLETAILGGIGWFRYFFPNKVAHMVLDEVTFLVPNTSDSEDVKSSKLLCFKMLQTLAVVLGYDLRSCQVVMSSSTPEICTMDIGMGFAKHCSRILHLYLDSQSMIYLFQTRTRFTSKLFLPWRMLTTSKLCVSNSSTAPFFGFHVVHRPVILQEFDYSNTPLSLYWA